MSLSSPCIRNCCLNDNDICLGCFRSLDEILLWGLTDTANQEKQHILDKAKQRKHHFKQTTS
ncbi:MAG: DUF1289 domain-containing protein [Methylophaga sp.]|nr:DUF1289 domain-containing protein [Methylophaga sp.]